MWSVVTESPRIASDRASTISVAGGSDIDMSSKYGGRAT
jgi:hypothetical protein